MDRPIVLLAGVVCWTVAAMDALYHLATGDLVAPAVMAVVFVLWVSLRAVTVKSRRLAAIRVWAD